MKILPLPRGLQNIHDIQIVAKSLSTVDSNQSYYDRLCKSNGYILLSDNENEFIGVCLIRNEDQIHTNKFLMHLTDLYIVPEYRGRGLAKTLVNWIIQLYKSRYRNLSLCINVSEPELFNRLFRPLGFRRIFMENNKTFGIYTEIQFY